MNDFVQHQALFVVHDIGIDSKVFTGDGDWNYNVELTVSWHDIPKFGDEVKVIFYKISLMCPILRFGIVSSQFDYKDIGSEVFGLLKLRLVPNREIAFAKESSATDPKVSYFIRLSKQGAYQQRIAVRIVTAGTLGDGVANKSDFNWTLRKRKRGKKSIAANKK